MRVHAQKRGAAAGAAKQARGVRARVVAEDRVVLLHQADDSAAAERARRGCRRRHGRLCLSPLDGRRPTAPSASCARIARRAAASCAARQSPSALTRLAHRCPLPPTVTCTALASKPAPATTTGLADALNSGHNRELLFRGLLNGEQWANKRKAKARQMMGRLFRKDQRLEMERAAGRILVPGGMRVICTDY